MGLMDLKKAELVALAQQNGVDDSGTKADIAGRLEDILDWDEEDEVEEAAVDEALMDDSLVPDPLPEPITINGNNQTLDVEAGSTDEFLQAAYLHILGREIDDGGRRHYRRVLDVYQTQTREQVVEDLLASDEYRRRAAD